MAAPRRKRRVSAWSRPPVCKATEGRRSESHASPPEPPSSTLEIKQVDIAHQIRADKGSLLLSTRYCSTGSLGLASCSKTIEVPQVCTVAMSPEAWVLCYPWLHSSYLLLGDSFVERQAVREKIHHILQNLRNGRTRGVLNSNKLDICQPETSAVIAPPRLKFDRTGGSLFPDRASLCFKKWGKRQRKRPYSVHIGGLGTCLLRGVGGGPMQKVVCPLSPVSVCWIKITIVGREHQRSPPSHFNFVRRGVK